MKLIWLLLIAITPSRLKIFILNLRGHDIHNTCHIGICILDIKKIVMKPHSRIANFNYFKGLQLLQLDEKTRIGGKLNWFTASELHDQEQTGFGEITIGEGSNITSRHFFDVQQKICIGSNTLIAGFRSTFWTHGYRNRVGSINAGISIGNNCYIGSQVICTPNVIIGNSNFVGTGSVLTRNFSNDNHCLIAGNPAKVRKQYDASDEFFQTSHNGFIPKEIYTKAKS